MNSSQLLNRTLANRLVCQTQQIAIGPTGPTGSASPYITIPGILKAFTIFVDYTSAISISRVYIPPGLFSPTNPTLAAGGIFTTNQGTDLTFLGLDRIEMENTAYTFVSAINASGYIAAGAWEPIRGGNISATALHYSVTNDNAVIIKGLDLANINGASTAPKPTSGAAAGFLATVTIFYM